MEKSDYLQIQYQFLLGEGEVFCRSRKEVSSFYYK